MDPGRQPTHDAIERWPAPSSAATHFEVMPARSGPRYRCHGFFTLADSGARCGEGSPLTLRGLPKLRFSATVREAHAAEKRSVTSPTLNEPAVLTLGTSLLSGSAF